MTDAGSRSASLDLRARLDSLYADFNHETSASDPIHIVRRFTRDDDRELVAFCASALAFGRVQSVLASIEGLLAVMGKAPAAYVRAFNPSRDRGALDHLVHRWTRGIDLAALLWVIRQMLDSHGSIERFFAEGMHPDAATVEGGVESFSRRACALNLEAVYGDVVSRPGVAYFFSRPSSGGACKRLNLFLRWMVRRDALDLGVWQRVRPAQLIIPLDTHVIRVGRCLGLTRLASPGWRMAEDITRSLRTLDPDDPVKYDFSLCHLGMMQACGFGRPERDAHCPLRGACRPRGRRRRL
ncbi:MAG: TIGR02757 family protein [Acidobacteriota bacterium]